MTTVVTADQILQVRRMTNELTSVNYTDALIISFIEDYPIPDGLGYFPDDNLSTDGEVQNTGSFSTGSWTPTYDLHAAAADIWDEKAGKLADKFDFSADGGQYSRSQGYKQALEMAKYHRARRKPANSMLRKRPREFNGQEFPWIGNLPEEE